MVLRRTAVALLLLGLVALSVAQTPTEGQLGVAVQGQLPAFVAYTLPSSVEASALVIESTFAPACSGIQLGLWRSSPFLANNSLPDVQPDYSLNALDLAYVLPDDAGGSWYVGLSHNGSTTCDFNLTAWVEPMRRVDWGETFTQSGEAVAGEWTYFAFPVPAATSPSALAVEYRADPSSCAGRPTLYLRRHALPTLLQSDELDGAWSVVDNTTRRLTFNSSFLTEHAGTWYVGALGTDSCLYHIAVLGTTDTTLAWDTRTVGTVAGNNGTTFYQVDDMSGQCDYACRALLVRLEADPSMESCFGSNLYLQLNQGSVPTSTAFLADVQRDFTETDPSVQALLYPVALSNSSPYYLGITNHANSACSYNITARLDDLVALAWDVAVNASSKPAFWDYYSFTLTGVPDTFTATLTLGSATCTPPPNLHLRRNGFPTLLRWDFMANATQTVNGTTAITFTGDAVQMQPGQWYIGVWGAQAAGQSACPYSLTVSQSEASPLTLGVDHMFSSQGQFVDYYSFSLSTVPPILELEVGADPANCPTAPKVGLNFMTYPTPSASNFGNWSTAPNGVQTLTVTSQYLASGTYFLGVFGQDASAGCSYVVHISTTTNVVLPFDTTTAGVANASSVAYYQLDQLQNNRVLLVRLEADASLSSCYGSSLIMQLNVNTLPTLTQFLPSAQRDFSDPGSAVAAQAMVYGVPTPDGTYYLGVFDTGSTSCPYNITTRMEYLDFIEYDDVAEGSLRPANWHYYSINIEDSPLRFIVNLTVQDLAQCPSPPTLYMRLNAYPNLIHSDYMLNASQMVGNSIIFTSDPAQVGAGQWNIGLWGTQGAQDARCNYQLTVHKDAADALTFGSLFSDTVEGAAPNYYSFALTDVPPVLLVEMQPEGCTEVPQTVLSLNSYPTPDQHDYPGPANWTVGPDGWQTLTIPGQQLQQGTYFMGVFGSSNSSCSYLLRISSTTNDVLPWDTITPNQVAPGAVSYYKLSPAQESKAIVVRVMTNPNEPQCLGSFLILKMFPETLPTSTSRLDDAQRDFSGPLDAVAAQDLIYGVKIDNRTFYIGVFNNGTSLCSYNVSARMENKAALAPGTFIQGVSRPLYWDYYTFDVGGEFDGISAQLTYDANCTTPPGLYLRRNAFPSRVRSDYGPESTVQSGNVISFSGNSSVALPGAWRLGVWGEVTNGAGNCPYTIALQLNRSTDLQLELGVVYTQSSTQPFADFFMFAITAIPPELIVQVTADPAECPTMPRALVRFGLEPTAGDYDFAQFVRTGDMLVLNLTAPILQLGTYYLGVFGNTSCTYSVKAFTQTHNVLPFGPVLANQLVIPSSYSYYALEPVPAESVLVLRVVTTTLACQDSDTLSLFLQKNTLATADDQIVDLQKDSAGPALDIVYGVSQAADYDPLATRFFASVYSVSAEACAYNISARLQNTTTLAFGQTASSSALTGYWSYFKLSFVAPPSDFTLEIDTVNCATQPSPYLRRQSYPTRVLSDFGPEAFTATSTGGGNQQLMFPGNVTAQLQAGTYYLGVFGQGTAGDECSFTVLAKASNQPNVTALTLGVNTTGTAMAQGWTYYSLSYMAPVRGVLSVNLDIAAGAPAACMVPAVQVLVERDVLPDLTEFLEGHNDSTPRSQVSIYRTMSLSPTTETYYVGVYSSLTASCAFHLTAQVTPLGVLSSAGTQMVGTTSAGPMWNYYLVDLTTMAPQPQLLYLLFNSTGCAQQPRVHLRKQYFPNAIASDYQFATAGTSQSLALNQTQLSTAAKWYVGVYGTSATGCDFTISALAQATIPSSTAGSPVSASSQPKTWSFYAVSVPASRKRADGGATPQVLVVEAAGGCASALDVFVRRGDYPTPASFDASSAQFRGGPNNTIVLVNGTQSAWPQGGSWYVGIYNRESASCAFALTSQFDAGVDLVKAGAKLSGSVTAGGYSFFYYSATKSATYYAHLTGPEKGSLNLYARIGQYPTRYESTASAVSKGSAAVQASVALKSGQSAYFAVYNPTSTAASFSVTVDSSGGSSDDGDSKTALWVILGIALGILGVSALAFVVYSISKQKPWIRRFTQMGSSSSRRYSVSTRYRPLVNDEESGSITMIPLSGAGRPTLDEPLLQAAESEADNDAL